MKILLSLSALALAALGLPFGTASSAPAPAATDASGAYEADAGHSSVVFATGHLGVSRFYGRFNEVSAAIQFNEADVKQSRVSIEIPAESIDSNNGKRDAHLKSPDFFSAKEFPVITFESKAVRGTKDALEIEGTLTLRGVAKPVTAQGRLVGSGETMFGDFRAGFEARLTMKPADFGFAFVEKNPKAVGPEVEVTVSLECVRQ